MARRISENVLNASTIDILNVIRQNASYEYQTEVPVVGIVQDIPHVGEVLMGHPALANQFINALVNRIALVRVQSATFNNPYSSLKKGYLEFGETVEEVFVNITKAMEFSAEKADRREHKRYLPDVRSAFHVMNWRVMYPVTIQDEDLRMAFLSAEGVRDLIARIVDAVYAAAEYDEFLLFKYLIIKAVTKGKMFPVSVDTAEFNNAAVSFRGIANRLRFMSNNYNAAGVTTNTPISDLVIFMDADFNARFDVNVLSAAFNMDKAEFIGKLQLIDDWATFDNTRFDVIRENSDGLEEVTQAELDIMKNVIAVALDKEWFQVYDNNNKFTEQYTASGLYWNYFYHVWKTISSSPFSNAVVFVDNGQGVTDPTSISFTVDSISDAEYAKVVTLYQIESDTVKPQNARFVQTEELTKAGVGVQRYGAFIIPEDYANATINIQCLVGGSTYNGSINLSSVAVGDTVTLTK